MSELTIVWYTRSINLTKAGQFAVLQFDDRTGETWSCIYGGKGGKSLSLKEINAQINELLKAAIQSEGVISLFDSSKTGGESFSLFDPAVLDEISRLKEKNIAVEILKKLMAEQVFLYKRTNVVQSQKFSEKIARLIN